MERRDDAAMTRADDAGRVADEHGRPAGVLVVAAWRDVSGPRIRVTFAEPDPEEPAADRTSVVTADRERVLELVDQWLRRVLRGVNGPAC